jgi:hypothetical protein
MISKAKGSKILLREKYFGSSKNTEPLLLSFFTTIYALFIFRLHALILRLLCVSKLVSAFGIWKKKENCAAAGCCLGRAMRK